jgi:hypothetical protein
MTVAIENKYSILNFATYEFLKNLSGSMENCIADIYDHKNVQAVFHAYKYV